MKLLSQEGGTCFRDTVYNALCWRHVIVWCYSKIGLWSCVVRLVEMNSMRRVAHAVLAAHVTWNGFNRSAVITVLHTFHRATPDVSAYSETASVISVLFNSAQPNPEKTIDPIHRKVKTLDLQTHRTPSNQEQAFGHNELGKTVSGTSPVSGTIFHRNIT